MHIDRLFILAVSFLLALTSPLCAGEPAQRQHRKRRILCNYDGWGVLLDRKGSNKHVAITVNDLKEAVREVTEEGSQVDTVLLCVNARVMYYPTKVGTVLGELATAEQRAKWTPVDKLWLANFQRFFADGYDPWAIMLEEARERGVEGLLSFRMNDMHQGEILDTKFWRDHPEFRSQ